MTKSGKYPTGRVLLIGIVTTAWIIVLTNGVMQSTSGAVWVSVALYVLLGMFYVRSFSIYIHYLWRYSDHGSNDNIDLGALLAWRVLLWPLAFVLDLFRHPEGPDFFRFMFGWALRPVNKRNAQAEELWAQAVELRTYAANSSDENDRKILLGSAESLEKQSRSLRI